MTQTQNDYEAQARARKVSALAAALRRNGVDADEAAAWSDLEWSHAARLAAVNMPSPTTQRQVVDILRMADGIDPFEGLAYTESGKAIPFPAGRVA